MCRVQVATLLFSSEGTFAMSEFQGARSYEEGVLLEAVP